MERGAYPTRRRKEADAQSPQPEVPESTGLTVVGMTDEQFGKPSRRIVVCW
jgi:hypothetical protein